MRLETSDDCYRHFLQLRGFDGDGDPDLIGLFAYALVERDRLDWIDHCAREGMPAPRVEDIRVWFSQKPQSYFEDKLKQAETRFDLYSRGYLADEIETGKKSAVDQAIGGLRADLADGHWLRSIAQGVFGNFAFAILLVLLVVIAAKDPSAVAWMREVLK